MTQSILRAVLMVLAARVIDINKKLLEYFNPHRYRIEINDVR